MVDYSHTNQSKIIDKVVHTNTQYHLDRARVYAGFTNPTGGSLAKTNSHWDGRYLTPKFARTILRVEVCESDSSLITVQISELKKFETANPPLVLLIIPGDTCCVLYASVVAWPHPHCKIDKHYGS